MPTYLFRCERCGREATRVKTIEGRNDNPPFCVAHKVKERMTRVATPANFTVTGFNAKNGYSK